MIRLRCSSVLSALAIAVLPAAAQPTLDTCAIFNSGPLQDFLSDVGFIDDIDLNGEVTVNNGFVSTNGNGVPDATSELRALENILNDPDFDNGVLTHQQVREAWEANYNQMRSEQFGNLLSSILEDFAPGLIELFAAYATLGDGFYNETGDDTGTGEGSFGFAAAAYSQIDGLLDLVPGIPGSALLADDTMNPQDFVLLTELAGIDTADADGDGLSNRDEFDVFGPGACNFKEDGAKGGPEGVYPEAVLTPDFDQDGMDDEYEARFRSVDGLPGLLPDQPDAGGNIDEDLLTNLEEFFRDSDPLDIDDPEITRFIGPIGSTEPFPDGGTRDNPWSLTFGLEQAPTNPGPNDKPTRLNLDPGIYIGDIVMTPGMIISSVPGTAKGGEATILGSITGAEGAKIQSITIEALFGNSTLLLIDDVSMVIEDVVFLGEDERTSTGILARGLANTDTVVDGALFTSLRTGMDIEDGVPKLRRCVFEDISQQQVIVRDSALTDEGGAGFGNTTDPEVGFNFFKDVGTTAVVNQRTGTLLTEENEWDTEDSTVIQSRVQGNVDTEPFLLTGQSVFNGLLAVTVTNALTGTPLTTASVSLAGGGGLIGPITKNDSPGVYVFDVVGAGTYTVTVDAGEAFAVRNVPFTVESGIDNSLIVAMSEPKADPPEPPAECCGAPGGKDNTLTADIGVAALAMLLMAAASRRGR